MFVLQNQALALCLCGHCCVGIWENGPGLCLGGRRWGSFGLVFAAWHGNVCGVFVLGLESLVWMPLAGHHGLALVIIMHELHQFILSQVVFSC